eukprot:scaffold7215_cov366-Prasinococcus_capsulatus_cf.AAC.9
MLREWPRLSPLPLLERATMLSVRGLRVRDGRLILLLGRAIGGGLVHERVPNETRSKQQCVACVSVGLFSLWALPLGARTAEWCIFLPARTRDPNPKHGGSGGREMWPPMVCRPGALVNRHPPPPAPTPRCPQCGEGRGRRRRRRLGLCFTAVADALARRALARTHVARRKARDAVTRWRRQSVVRTVTTRVKPLEAAPGLDRT